MGGSEGQQAVNNLHTPDSLSISKRRTDLLGMPGIGDILGEYGAGKLSLEDAMSKASGLKYDPNKGRRDDIAKQIQELKASRANDPSQDNFRRTDEQIKNLEQEAFGLGDNLKDVDTAGLSDLLATDARTAGTFARGELMKDDFYKGGLESFKRAGENEQKYSKYADEDRLAMSGKDPSYGLTEGDYAAYGQGAGNIARMFGQQEQNLAQMLADRGMAAAPSGVGVAGFSGLQGNKAEQLAKLQTDIAQQRIDKAADMVQKRASLNQQLLGQTQDHMRGLGAQGQEALNKQIANQMGARQQNEKSLADVTEQEQNQMTLEQNQANEAFAQKKATKKSSLGEVIGDSITGNLANSVGSVFGAPGKLIDSMTTSAGKSIGSSFGKPPV